MSDKEKSFIHPSAVVASDAKIGKNTSVWLWCQIRERASIGDNCTVSKGVYIDFDVTVGNNVKIQNHVSIYHGVTIEDGVFIGPHVCFTNDFRPRAVTVDGKAKSATDWTISKTLVRSGASLGANSTIVCGVTVGSWAMVGSGSVVTKDVPPHALVVGNPARIRGYVCRCGAKLEKHSDHYFCKPCQKTVDIPK